MLKRIALITILFGLCGSVAFAQLDDGKAKSGSVYSKIGVGYPLDIGNVAAQSMGLQGVSYNETLVGSLSNPAHWGGTVYGLGTGGVGIKTYSASNATQSAKNANFTVNQFQLQLPLIRNKLGISGSFSPVTEANFFTLEEDRQITQDTLNFGIINRGSGGVNRAEFGLGWRVTSNISVGYAASALFLSMDDSFVATFPQQPYRDANYMHETSGVGFGNRFGTFVELPNLFRNDDQLRFGATMNLPVTLDSERKETGSIGGSTGEFSSEDGSIKLPMKITGGVSYSPSNLLMVGAEGFYEKWSDYQNDFKSSEEQLYEDRYKLGLGMQYFPYVTGSDKFLSYFKYRVGASYDTGHLRVEGQKINTLKFSFGLGIRSPRSRSSVDLSFEYGIRGTETMNLAQEQIWGVSLSLNLAELMFFRPKLQ